MQSLKRLFKSGPGPSSSHTIGPFHIATTFKKKNIDADAFEVILYGSLALTGKGHRTDMIIEQVFSQSQLNIVFDISSIPEHPNTMELKAFKKGIEIDNMRAYSIGGGEFIIKGTAYAEAESCFAQKSFQEIKKYLINNNISLVEYVQTFDDKDILDYLEHCLDLMFATIEAGLNRLGKLPGELNLDRIAKYIYTEAISLKYDEQKKMLLTAFAYATAEENASGGSIVTAPTCGSSGVLSSCLYYYYKYYHVDKSKLVGALAVAGVFGNLIKTNASISGAVAGCQAEIGAACSMAAAAIAYLEELNIMQIEYAAEVALEHHLGLTCDPVKGLVQIPCIERNAVAALRAVDAAMLAKFAGKYRKNKISFDNVVTVMMEVGDCLASKHKETSLGGLATVFNEHEE